MSTNTKVPRSSCFRRSSSFLALTVLFTFFLAFTAQPIFAIDDNSMFEFDAEDVTPNPVADDKGLAGNGT